MQQAFITLNGESFSQEEMPVVIASRLNHRDIPPWEKDIYRFLEAWLNDADHIVVHTSGSTGIPKSIALKKARMEYSARQTCNFFGLGKQSTALLCLPAAYIAGRMMLVRALVSGMNLKVCEPTGNPFAAQDEKIDFVAITPFQLHQSLNSLARKDFVHTAIVGGGEISPALENQIQCLPVQVYATYGMTETSSHVALRKVNGTDRQEYFNVLGDTRIELDERSCLVLENPALFEGRLHTNDMAEIITPCTFLWLGRYDNVINSGGVKIRPEEIEQKIASLRPETLIIAPVPDEKLGQAVVLFVESAGLSPAAEKQLLDAIRLRVHPYAVPGKIYFNPVFPKTPTGKIDRKALTDF